MGRPPKKDNILTVIRVSKGLNRPEVASKADITSSNLWRAETGQIVSDIVAFKIANALEISPDILFYNMGSIPPEKREFVMKDPLFFKGAMDELCADPSKLTKTKEYMEKIKATMKLISPNVSKLLSKVKDQK